MSEGFKSGMERISSAPRLSITTYNVFNMRNHNLSQLSRSSPGIFVGDKCGKDLKQQELLHPLNTTPKSILIKAKDDSISEIVSEEELEENKSYYKLRLELQFTAFVLICFILVIVTPISMIVMGSIYIFSCPVENMIPIFLIVGGSTFLFTIAMVRKLNRLTHNNEMEKSCYQKSCSAAFIFHFGWFATGCYWVYSIYEPEYNAEDSSSYCHKTLYLYSFWFLNAIFLTLSLFAILFTVYIVFGREQNNEIGSQV